jgi:eukaryotic-like serine/threonine-protein kinase
MGSDQLEQLNLALAGRYALDRQIGMGGMATVYLARDLKHHREVALKVLRSELAIAFGPERFLREIEVAARLTHPHILPLYESGEAGGFLFYTMPFVKGESLRQKLQREKQLTPERAVVLTSQIASALEYAHAHDVIHRDIKPENILLHEGEAMVADFGLALAVSAPTGERLTSTGIMVGTPAYMSPEQATGEQAVDARTDVYSLGCLLYEMLAGEPPFVGSSRQATLTKRLSDPAPDVRRLRPAVPASIGRAISKALERIPADRFTSAMAFADALAGPGATRPAANSVAVLPFRNLSADPDNEYFADGITEDIIAQLSKIRALKVISRTSIMRFKTREQSMREIGAALETATLLDGSVRRAGDRVRIVAQLIDADTDQHLWADTYDRQLTDVFAIQTDVAFRIAAALRAELSADETTRIRKEPTRDLHAYQLYLQGRHCLVKYTTEEMRKAIGYFEQAIELDPNYALAYAGVATGYGELGETGALTPEEAYRHAREAATTALELDSGLGEAHSILGMVKVAWEFDWAGAEREFQRALELNPSNADAYDLYGRMCSALERHDEAISMERRAQELDPLAHRSDFATGLLRAGRYEEALREAERAVEFDPDYDRGHATLGWAYIRNGRNAEGVTELEKAVSLSPGNTTWLAQLGQAYAVVGRTSDAREVLRRLSELSLQRYVSPYHMAYIYAGLGEHDAAIDWLERAYNSRAGAVYGIKGSFLFVALRSHPRFVALLKKMNLA